MQFSLRCIIVEIKSKSQIFIKYLLLTDYIIIVDWFIYKIRQLNAF